MSDLHVEATELRSLAPRFTECANSLVGAADRLQGLLSGLGSFWGDDTQGAAFASSYQPHVAQLLPALRTVADGVRSVDPALTASADGYDHTDATAAARLHPEGPAR